ncbi:uncharacterized protein BP01DRAFT_353761 [Aspergillus saccharolyticus JOP 1030-1]|uniref:Uncharacterized protein n=1 Tax=Aspergillus saccharolyticus JOP 1030-1 TaxID=1450539 RepID=A0A318ZWB5_9EURO|nr:hypothetical protein BP01DRAFT_353761 [Aspergillus saccharolyticus JOP 1030-1]PYH48623.1 hypothetical protein BP01DRAFT_353761 [Aspergillus saccharolyticus JOP 1030-1]
MRCGNLHSKGTGRTAYHRWMRRWKAAWSWPIAWNLGWIPLSVTEHRSSYCVKHFPRVENGRTTYWGTHEDTQ